MKSPAAKRRSGRHLAPLGKSGTNWRSRRRNPHVTRSNTRRARAVAASGVVVPDAYVNRDANADAPIHVGGGSPMIYGAVVNGRPPRVIVLTQEPMAMDHVIAKPGIGAIEDLKGKRLGFSGVGAVMHFSALALTRELRWTVDRDISLVGGSATLEALQQDKVDAILTSAMVIARATPAGYKTSAICRRTRYRWPGPASW